jgi:ClpP class serine protease
MNYRLLSTPWAIFPPCSEEARRRLDIEASDIFDLLFTPRNPLAIENGTAHIHVTGALLDDAPPISALMGDTDYRTLIDEIKDAEDEDCEEIVFHIDSPGGMVSGLAEVIAAINGSGMKTIADCRGMACSAAYWIASACDKIQASPSTILGSIGVVTVWLDTTEALNKMGLQINVMANEGADLKGAGMGSSLSDSQIEFMQERLNRIGADFRAHVEGQRANISPEVFRAGY